MNKKKYEEIFKKRIDESEHFIKEHKQNFKEMLKTVNKLKNQIIDLSEDCVDADTMFFSMLSMVTYEMFRGVEYDMQKRILDNYLHIERIRNEVGGNIKEISRKLLQEGNNEGVMYG